VIDVATDIVTEPVEACEGICGDANGDETVNVSDAVYIISYVFVGGGAPGDCAPGSADWLDVDCCLFE
jgi:hypothetical protein